jgi:hypothetical protein
MRIKAKRHRFREFCALLRPIQAIRKICGGFEGNRMTKYYFKSFIASLMNLS